MNKYPDLSILIITLNSERTIYKCLENINKQNYSSIKEVLIVDGGSTDKTLEIAKSFDLPIKIINGKYKNNQEARRGVGIKLVKSKYFAMIDSDNYIYDENWLKEMMQPFLENDQIVASQTLRYSVPKDESILNRYFGLFGATDPVAYYLGKTDRLSWRFREWNLKGKMISKNKNYSILEFNPDDFLTVGCNGIIIRKNLLLKSKWRRPEDFFHSDVFVDIGRQGFNKFAIVNNEIFHDTSENLFNFFAKRRRYMMLHYGKYNNKRRFKIFDEKKISDYVKLFLFIFFALTIIQPLYMSLAGYIRKNDFAWFAHPLVCLGVTIIYTEAILRNLIIKYK